MPDRSDTARGTYRQARIDAAIDACTNCGSYEFPKRPDCDGCISAVDEEIAHETPSVAALAGGADITFDKAIARACEEPSLLKALVWVAMWENDRAVKQAREHSRWETCFERMFEGVFAKYPVDIASADPPPFPPWSADAAELLFSIANSVWFLLRATAAADDLHNKIEAFWAKPPTSLETSDASGDKP